MNAWFFFGKTFFKKEEGGGIMETSIKAGVDAYFTLVDLHTGFAEAPNEMAVSKIGTTQVPTPESSKVDLDANDISKPASEQVTTKVAAPEPARVNLDVGNGATPEAALKGSHFDRWV